MDFDGTLTQLCGYHFFFFSKSLKIGGMGGGRGCMGSERAMGITLRYAPMYYMPLYVYSRFASEAVVPSRPLNFI